MEDTVQAPSEWCPVSLITPPSLLSPSEPPGLRGSGVACALELSFQHPPSAFGYGGKGRGGGSEKAPRIFSAAGGRQGYIAREQVDTAVLLQGGAYKMVG